MPRLKNTATGVVVNVSDATAALLGPEYAPAEDSEPSAKRTTSSRKAAKSDDDDE